MLAVHAPVLGGYFFGDDFVPLADISTRSTWGYVRDLFLLRDLTPNWRFLTGLYYLVLYRAFGLHALPFLLSNVLVHIGTAGLIFWFVRRVTRENWPAFLAAMFFGLSAAYVPTVGQVTAFNNVLAGFMLMLSLVTLYEGFERQDQRWWLASVVAFAFAIAANESAAVLAPVLALTIVWRAPARPDRWLYATALTLPFLILGAGALATFGACRCTEADGLLSSGGHVWSNLWMYLGRLLYPIGLEAPGHISSAHLAAGISVAVLAGLALLFGSGLARIAALFLALAIVPYLPIELWSASRYVYVAAIPFSILAALYFTWLGRLLGRFSPALAAAVALVALGVIGVYGWQTWDQEQELLSASKDWYTLTTGLDETYPDLPANSVVYVRGSPLSDALLQCAVLPAVGEVLWGDGKVFTYLQGDLSQYRTRPGYRAYVVDQHGDDFLPVDVPVASPTELIDPAITLLPHVPPNAHGNLCLSTAERFP